MCSRGLLTWLVVAGTLVACGGPAAHPDSNAMKAAQTKWCDAVASEDNRGACEGATLAASPEYVAGMADCLPRRVEAAGKGADVPQILADCEAEVAVGLPEENAAGKAVLKARCDHMAKCDDDITVDACADILETMESGRRAGLTTMYNDGVLADVADCMASAGCDDETEVETACYEDVVDRKLWFPE